jgi:sigma-E factor negative regulatory protein RseC
MNETGIIISTDGEKAVIQLNRGEKCNGCTACQTFGENKMRLEVPNSIGAAAGDVVDINVEPKQVIKSSMIIFIFPLVMMLVGYFGAVRFIAPHSEGVGIIGAFAAIVFSFVLIKITDKRRNPDDVNPAVLVGLHKNISVKKG